MLVLSRERNEKIFVGDDIVITITDIRGDKVRIGIEAPEEIHIVREELVNKTGKITPKQSIHSQRLEKHDAR